MSVESAASAPLVAIVVVTFNSASLVAECLESIEKLDHPAVRVIVVDNASRDTTGAVVAATSPSAELIELAENTGFAGANNVGIRVAFADPDCRYVALVNADARLDAGWLSTLVAFAQAHPDGASFQGLTLSLRDPNVVDSRGLVVNRNGLAIQVGHGEPRGDYAPHRVFGVNAAAALYARSFLVAQPFGDFLDEDLFMYYEDVDLAARAVVMGWSNYVVPDAIAFHLGGASKSPRTATRLLHRNGPLVLLKNFPPAVLRNVSRGYLDHEARTLRQLYRDGGLGAAGAAALGMLQSLWYVPRFLRKRVELNRYARATPDEIWAQM